MNCKTCKNPFEPIIGFNGLVKSKNCKECDYLAERSKRLAKMAQSKVIDIKEGKKALKTKLSTCKESLPVQKKRKTSERKLIEKLDKVFSLFIRIRDTKNGVFSCISCGKNKPYSQADAGHFINRQHLSVRFDEVNVNAQCRKCNRFQEGNNQGYRLGLISKYGNQAVNLLDVKKSMTLKFSSFELELLIKHYEGKVKDFEKMKLLEGNNF